MRPFRLKLSLFAPFTLLLASGLVHGDQITTFSFTGTLATAIANQTAVTGKFSVDVDIRAITAFSFTTPVGSLITSDDPNPAFKGAIDPSDDEFLTLDIATQGATPTQLSLAFSGFPDDRFATKFSGGPLYTGPLLSYPFGPYDYSLLSGPAGSSRFTSGFAAPLASPAPEPATFALLGFAFTLARSPILRLPSSFSTKTHTAEA